MKLAPNILSELIELWNDERRCDFCWTFEAPLTLPALNMAEKTEDDKCCVHVFLTNLRIIDNNSYPENSRRLPITQSFSLYFLMHGDMGVNNWEEIKGHSLEDSNWKRILEPLMICLEQFNFCEVDSSVRVINRNFVPVINWNDSNYTGWNCTMAIENF